MKKDIRIEEKYLFDKEAYDTAINDDRYKYAISMKILGCYSPVYFADFGYGDFTKISKFEDVPSKNTFIVYYEHSNDSNSDWFSIMNYDTMEMVYSSTPKYEKDDAGNIYLYPQYNLFELKEITGTDFFENLMLTVICRDYEFKKDFIIE